ncbi:hypothetical protein [Citrobacter braakii]|uniref:hypothetical protein n=1 Tax=Citrobacter braakii TaxID=57706 RepID=UPI004039E250
MAGNSASMKVKVISGILVACVAIAMSYYRHHSAPPITTFDELAFGQSFDEVKAKIECYLPQPEAANSVFADAIKDTDCTHYMFNGDTHWAGFEFINDKLSRVSIEIYDNEWKTVIPLLTKRYGAADHQLTAEDMYEIEHGSKGKGDVVTFGDTGQVSLKVYQAGTDGLQQTVIIQSPTRQKDYDNASNYSA